MKKFNLYLVGSLFLTLFSCSKEDIVVDRELVNAYAEIEFSSEVDFNSGIDAASDNSSFTSRSEINSNTSLASCATVTVDNATPGVFPKTFTIDFGSGCVSNGILRSGSITVTVTNYIMTAGSVTTIVRGNNYYINGRKVEGTIVYENTTTDVNNPKWNRTITNGRTTTTSGDIYTHSGTRTVKQIAGVSTLTLVDNIYEITTGNHTITKNNNNTLTATVVEPLIKKYACAHISQGQLDLQGSILDGILDYGDNTCDYFATYTHSNGVVYDIVLN